MHILREALASRYNLGLSAIIGDLSLFACLPAEVDLLGESDGGIVVGDLSECARVGAGERNAVVDIQQAIGAARRPDNRCGWYLVLLRVDSAIGPGWATFNGRFGGGLSERSAKKKPCGTNIAMGLSQSRQHLAKSSRWRRRIQSRPSRAEHSRGRSTQRRHIGIHRDT
jgi:hypothetical protein